jgi:predicted deacylase
MQRAGGDGVDVGAHAGGVEAATRSGGEALDAATLREFGRRFGHDFSAVRVHRDGASAASARAVRARAYTVGHDIVFGAGAWAPGTTEGRRLLAHELVHVVQQSRAGPRPMPADELPVSRPDDAAEREADRVGEAVSRSEAAAPEIVEAPRALARAPLNVAWIDRLITQAPKAKAAGIFEPLFAKGPQYLGHVQGEIAFAANYPGGTAPAKQPASPVPKADSSPVPVDKTLPVVAHYFPSGRLQSTERALILGGFHGDERPGWEVLEALVTELSAPAAPPLFFHTIVVPRVNAAGIADELGGLRFWRNRCNRQVVDLNRNFPTGGKPADTNCVNTDGAPTQPEVEGVIDLIKTFKPDRILSTHAITDPKHAGVFADLNTDPAAIALARGMASTIVDASNRPFNRLSATDFNPIYPLDSPGKVSGGTSLGAFGPTATGGNIPVITIEAPGFGSLGSTGTRTTEAFLRPVRAFLTDPALLDTKADEDILTDIDSFAAADRLAFLTGRLKLSSEIYARIRLRVDTAVARLNALSPAPPTKVTVKSGLRLYSEAVPGPTGGSAQAQIVFNKFFLQGSPDTESFPTSYFKDGDRSKGVDPAIWLKESSATRLAIILKFSALPGASRHHWATDVDFNSMTSSDWAPAPSATAKPGPLFDLGVWLQANAARVGFVQSYTPGRAGGYNEEPWHYSYAPIALGLRQRYNLHVNLSKDVADAFVNDMKGRAGRAGLTVPTDLESAVKALKISDFVNTIGPDL